MCSEDVSSYRIEVIHAGVWDPHSNIDVEVILSNGDRWSATFFALANIEWLFKKNRATGECAGGLYFWAVDMIIVENVTLETIDTAIADIVADGRLETACSFLGNVNDPEEE